MGVKSKLVNVKQLVRSKREWVKFFHAQIHFMRTGSYLFDRNMMYICINDKSIKQLAQYYFGKGEHFRIRWKLANFVISSLLFKNEVHVKNTEAFLPVSFEGVLFFPGNNNDANSTEEKQKVKIFDFANQKVLSIFSDFSDFHVKLETYKWFSKYFFLPSIIYFDANKKLTIEQFVSYNIFQKQTLSDCFWIFETLLKQYEAYFKVCKIEGNYTLKSLDSLSKHRVDQMAEIERETTPSVLRTQFPFVKLHGDLWRKNILAVFKEGILFIVDWEYSNEYFLLYDFFNFVRMEATALKKWELLDRYLDGFFDEHLISALSVFEIDFEPRNRIDYIRLYYLNFLSKRVNESDSRAKELYYTQYRLLERYSHKFMESRSL